jgi:YggT family protein
VIIEIVTIVLTVFIYLLLARWVISMIMAFSRDWRPKGAALVVVEGVFSVTDPPVKALRAVLPEINLGGLRLDLSILVLIILTMVAINILSATR